MSRLIILEGLDGVGKTSVALAIQRRLGHRTAIVHAGPPVETGAIAEYVEPLHGLAATDYTVICDRWYLSERVWPDIFGRESLFRVDLAMPFVEAMLEDYFDEIQPRFLERSVSAIRKDRTLDYDPFEALKLYGEAMADSRWYWERTTMAAAMEEFAWVA